MSFLIPLASAPATAKGELTSDFVLGDVAALAAHMHHCARARGPLFKVRGGLQAVHSIAAGHIVTLACVSFMLALGLSSIV